MAAVETYIRYNPRRKGKEIASYQVIKEGDPQCQHERSQKELTSDSGIIFVEYKCHKCGRKLAECIGECHPPEDENKNWRIA